MGASVGKRAPRVVPVNPPAPENLKYAPRDKRMIAFVEKYVYVPEGAWVGRPMQLLEEQRAFIHDVYGKVRPDKKLRCRRGIFCTPRKNGKTGLIASLLEGHLIGPEAEQNSNVYSAARSRDQASLVFNYAAKSLRLNPKLEGLVQISDASKKIIGLTRNVNYKALSAESTTAHGLNPKLTLHDELGQVIGPNDALYDALETAGGAQAEPLSLIISTQAPNDNDLLSTLIDDGLAQMETNPLECNTVVHLHAAPREADIFDPAVWARANFALGKFRSLTEFEEAAKRAKRMPSFEATYRNLYLNQRISRDALFIPPEVWKSCRGEVDPSIFYDGRPVHVGLDLSMRTDLTAMVASCVDDEGVVHLLLFAFTPAIGLEERAKRDRAPYVLWAKQGLLECSPGAVIAYDWVCQRAAEHTDGMNIVRVGFDRWRIDLFRQQADQIGWASGATWEPIGQGYRDMSPRLELFEGLCLSKQIRHNGHAVMNMAASNAIAIQDPAGNRKLEKSRSTARIDPLVAAVMSVPALINENTDIPMFIV